MSGEGRSALFIRESSIEEDLPSSRTMSRTSSLRSVREEASVNDDTSYSSLSVPSKSNKKTGKWKLSSLITFTMGSRLQLHQAPQVR